MQKAPSEAEVTLAPRVIETAPFDTETLYSLLVAELAGSRDRLDIMLSNYVQQAIETQDAGITERAAQLASYLHQPTETLQMSSQWASLDPTNPQARYMAMAALTDAGRYFEAFEHGQYLIEHGQDPHGLDALAAKASMPSVSVDDVASLTQLFEQLRVKFPNNAQLLIGLSFLQYKEGDYSAALMSARNAEKVQPELEQAYLQELRILQKQDPALAKQRLSEIVTLFPNNKQIRLQYARDLTESDLGAAAVQFDTLLQQSPGDANITLALALTYFQNKDYEQAQGHFLALTNNPPQADTAHYYLGKIATEQNQPLKAIDYYLAVKPSKEFLPALAHAVQLMHQHDRASEALQVLLGYQISAKADYQEGIALLLADHYKESQQPANARATYDDAIKQFPRSITLLYSRAMFFAEQNQLDGAERDFKTVLSINPDHAEALNSLGYLLADANIKLPEALAYIERALTLDPDNPATLDSMGWVLYRTGKLTESIEYLQQAMAKMPNDEIAAHLGEVLWANQQNQAAVEIWKQGLALNPNSRYIFERLKRFNLLPASPAPESKL